jgi:short-subunit dehydrogenase
LVEHKAIVKAVSMTQFNQQKALVVGASRGVGREITRQLAAAGAEVLALARSESTLKALAREVPGIDTQYIPIHK